MLPSFQSYHWNINHGVERKSEMPVLSISGLGKGKHAFFHLKC